MQSPEIDFGRMAQDLQLKRKQVEAAVALLDEGNTVPFITRYRKEQTGGLDEQQIRAVQRRVQQLRQLAERRQTVLRSIEGQGKLTDALREAILAAPNPRRLEDLYLPYKPRKQTLATLARQRGLGPLAEAIWNRDPLAANLEELLAGVVDPEKNLHSVDDVLAGLRHIFAEMIAEHAEARDAARRFVWQHGKITSSKVQIEPENAAPAIVGAGDSTKSADQSQAKAEAGSGDAAEAAAPHGGEPGAVSIETDEEGEIVVSFAPEARPEKDVSAEFRNYFSHSEPVERIPPHRILALNRGEKLGVLKIRIEVDRGSLESAIRERLPLTGHPHGELIGGCVADATERLILRSLEREVRNDLTEFAEEHSVSVFVKNLRNLLLQPPVHGRRVLAIDPGYRSGCKYAVIDQFGNPLDHGVMYPHATKKKGAAKRRLRPTAVGRSKIRLEPADAPQEFAAELSATDEAVAVNAAACGPLEAESASSAPGGAERQMDDPQPSAAVGESSVPIGSVHRSTTENDSPPSDNPSELEAMIDALPDTEEKPTDVPADAGDVPAAEMGGESSAESNAETASTSPTDIGSPESAEQEVARLWREVGPKPIVSPAWFGIVIPTPDNLEKRLERKERKRKAKTVADGESGAKKTDGPQLSRREQVKRQIANMCKRHGVDVIAIGNGAACRETEELIAELLSEDRTNCEYVIVNEAGASVYSTNAVGREEFPQFDATTRGTISIGRRLQDPLSELVKIDPPSLGVGLYQHDIGARKLRESLVEVVESCVNFVGVNLNTASASLLQHVSGLNPSRARAIVEHRQAHGPFRNREQLKEVTGIGPAVYTQAAGFLRIPDGDQPLDATWIHPESYPATAKVLAHLGVDLEALRNREGVESLNAKLAELDLRQLAGTLEISETLLADIVRDLSRPGRDPREDLPPPVFKRGVLKLEDLTENMRLRGTVLNVVDFGAFVDIGLKDSGLVHISQMANRFIRSPHEAVSVGDVVTVWVLSIDRERRRVSLTMIEPGTPRQQPQRRQDPRSNRQDQRRPPRPERGAATTAPATGDAATPGDVPVGQERRENRGDQRRQGTQRAPARSGQGLGQGRPGRHGGDQRRQGPRKNQSTTSKAVELANRKRQPPRQITLSDDALAGKENLRSFGELKEFFKAKKNRGGDDKQSQG